MATLTTPTRRSLAPLFSPKSVAVVGASQDPRKWGNWLARGALRGRARRSVYLVNHRAQMILGEPAYPKLAELPEQPELVVIALPAAALRGAVEDALGVGARAIVAISATDNDNEASAQADAALARRVRAHGAVLVGPNCLGVLDSGEQLELVTNPLPPGSIGLLSQSGNLALELGLLARDEGLGFSRFVSVGNQADLTAAEVIVALAEHDETRLIALYMEDFRDGRAFARAATAARTAGKHVVMLAIERGHATSRAVRSHTGALASEGAAIDAACAAAGIDRVHSPRELIDVAQALLRAPARGGKRLAVVSDGGGHGSVAAALAAAERIEVPSLSEPAARRLRAMLPGHAAVLNPVDLAGGAEQDVHTFERVARVLLESGEVDALLITGYFGGYGEYGAELAAEERVVAARLGELAQRLRMPILVHAMYNDSEAARMLRVSGVPTYRTIDQAVRGAARLLRRREPRERIPALPPPARQLERHDYSAAHELLRSVGVPMVDQRTVTGPEQAVQAAAELGYPVVLKALGALHKSDRGGVVLGLSDEGQLRQAFAALAGRLGAEAYSVEAMAPLSQGVELLIGSRWDARFGPVAVVASGGLHTETLSDAAVALAPVSEAEAEAMVRSLRIAPILSGARGRLAARVDAAARALAALSRLAAAHPAVREIEVNPLLVTPTGAIGLDARIVPGDAHA